MVHQSVKSQNEHQYIKRGHSDNPYLNVCHAMVVEVRAGRKAFPTHLALVGLLARVDASMCVQRTGRAEALAADETHVRFFTCLVH